MGSRAGRWAGAPLTSAPLLLAASHPRTASSEDPSAREAGGDDGVPSLRGSDPKEPLPDGARLEEMAKRVVDPATVVRQAQATIDLAVRGGGGAIKSFPNVSAVALALVPDAALAFHRTSFESLLTIRAKDRGKIDLHVARCLVVAILLEPRTQQTDAIRLAAAFGRLAHAWARIVARAPVDSAKVVAAAATVQSVAAPAGLSPKAWNAFGEAALLHGDLHAAVGAWAKAEIARQVQANPADPAVLRTVAFRALVAALRPARKDDISVRREGPAVEDDPERDFLLESMAEPDPAKGK